MRASAIKKAYLMGGTFLRDDRLFLGAEDSGESWLAAPDQVPVLDGREAVPTAIWIEGARDVTVRALAIRNYEDNGIVAFGVDGVKIDGNAIRNIDSKEWFRGAIRGAGSGDFTNCSITGNLIEDCGYNGISVHGDEGARIDNLTIARNEVRSCVKTVADGGAIYVMDRQHASAGIAIDRNVVALSESVGARGIYLDDFVSNVTVTNNIVWGDCEWAIQFHGGDRNVVENNIFDISESGKLGLYQDCPGFPSFGMGGNIFRNNIVYSSGAFPASLWDFWISEHEVLPEVSSNRYWPAGTAGSYAGATGDASPVFADPRFRNPEEHDYRFIGAVSVRRR